MDYIVAFVYTRETGGYEGVVTWTAFRNKQHFDDQYTPDIKAWKRVVEEGITQERAIELAQQTPLACYIAAALQEAEIVDGFKLRAELDKTMRIGAESAK